VLKKVTLESGLLLGGALFLAGFAGWRLDYLGVGGQRFGPWLNFARFYLGHVAVPGFADYFRSFS